MRHRLSRTLLAGTAAVISLSAAGCYEEIEPASAGGGQPAAESPPETGPRPGTPAQPGLGGAQRAAQNTIDRINERQRELEGAMKDP